MKANLDTPFNEDFCAQLEYQLGRTFRNSNRPDIKDFWCDGIICEPITMEELNKSHKVETKAWIGKSGQDNYSVIIQFGEKALSSFNKGENLIDTIPSDEFMNWIEIDTNKRTIEIKLK